MAFNAKQLWPFLITSSLARKGTRYLLKHAVRSSRGSTPKMMHARTSTFNKSQTAQFETHPVIGQFRLSEVPELPALLALLLHRLAVPLPVKSAVLAALAAL